MAKRLGAGRGVSGLRYTQMAAEAEADARVLHDALGRRTADGPLTEA